MISYASAIAATPARCRRFLDDAAPGSLARVCGAPVAGGQGLRECYCQARHAVVTTPMRSRPRVPRAPIADDWVMPTAAELEEVFG